MGIPPGSGSRSQRHPGDDHSPAEENQTECSHAGDSESPSHQNPVAGGAESRQHDHTSLQVHQCGLTTRNTAADYPREEPWSAPVV